MRELSVLSNKTSATQKNNLQKVQCVVAIAAGKGGVGKSTVTVNLARMLLEQNYRVGVLDADIYGPSIAHMLGVEGATVLETEEESGFLIPCHSTERIAFVSAAHFVPKKQAALLRAPIVNQIVEQFSSGVSWGELDFLFIDFPPGTGDIQLTLMQKMGITASVMVTTPQEVSISDVRKCIQSFQQFFIPIVGVIENMSYLSLEGGQKVLYPFGRQGGKALAQEYHVPLLTELPIDSSFSFSGDRGESLLKYEESLGIDPIKKGAKNLVEKIKALPKDEVGVFHVAPDRILLHSALRGEKLIKVPALQSCCPCAQCQEKPVKSYPDVVALHVAKYGKYAIKVQFSSGCSKGIYPLEWLLKC